MEQFAKIVYSIAILILQAFAIKIIWNWFLVPAITVNPITVWVALGLSSVYAVINLGSDLAKAPEFIKKSETTKFWVQVLLYLSLLFMAWITHVLHGLLG